MYRARCPQALSSWDRWINVHSRRHMVKTYPEGYRWYGKQSKPIYLQRIEADVPSSQEFPQEQIRRHFGHDYFTCSLAWLLAWAILLRADEIDLWGVGPDKDYHWQRPCLAYWVQLARAVGITVHIPAGVDFGDPGDPATYTGPLYGYQTT